MQTATSPQYPLLESMLKIKGLPLQATYTNADVASIFATSTRTIQQKVTDGILPSRKLIGHARFLPIDLEMFLAGGAKVANS